MPRPIKSTKVLLVTDPRSVPGSRAVPVRRYRLARLRFNGRAAEPAGRYEHLKRVYD